MNFFQRLVTSLRNHQTPSSTTVELTSETPESPSTSTNFFQKIWNHQKTLFLTKRSRYLTLAFLDITCIALIIMTGMEPASRIISPLINSNKLQPLTESKSNKEVFGFAPHWTFNRLDNVDFNVLTTFAYFGLEIGSDGHLIKEGPGYDTFKSQKATDTFKKAHAHGTRVVLTITQMKNPQIRALMDDPQAQQYTIDETVALVKERGIDGVNIDIEYTGNPGPEYRQKFSTFVANMTEKMHREIPSSRVSVSVYASAVKEPKIYDIASIGNTADLIFMMAYDFAVAGSDNAIPTAPLYGHKEGKYWYDVATAVEDFTKQMPAQKLVLGVPYYGYNYMVYEPTVKAETRPTSWRGKSRAQTYSIVQDDITAETEGIDSYTEGWDDYGKVSYKAYRVTASGTWRMVFVDDEKSLKYKYDFVKDKNLAGVGMWALGFDNGKTELWTLLAESFGTRLAQVAVESNQ
jgi:spore germination protein YaaH